MKNIYIIGGIIFILILFSFIRKYPSINLQNNFISKSRALDEGDQGKENTRIQKKQIINNQIIQEMNKMEEEEDQRRFELSKKIINENIYKWLIFTKQNNTNISNILHKSNINYKKIN